MPGIPGGIECDGSNAPRTPPPPALLSPCQPVVAFGMEVKNLLCTPGVPPVALATNSRRSTGPEYAQLLTSADGAAASVACRVAQPLRGLLCWCRPSWAACVAGGDRRCWRRRGLVVRAGAAGSPTCSLQPRAPTAAPPACPAPPQALLTSSTSPGPATPPIRGLRPGHGTGPATPRAGLGPRKTSEL